MNTHFQNHNLTAKLCSQSYHQVFIPEEGYLLGMGTKFTNVHIEVERDYYANLLSDSEEWSAKLRRKLFDAELYYPGEFKLSQAMTRVIYEIFNSPLTGYLKRVLIEAKIHELIALQLSGSEFSSQPKENSTQDLFMEIKNFLDNSFLEEHSLKNISRQFGVNEFALKKGFKTNFNTTVFEYLLSRRLDHAQLLLLNTSKPVGEISSIIGYKYSNHFSAAFKKKFGVSPASLKS
jgi:AraC-type DNA-binding domain-containing proteins